MWGKSLTVTFDFRKIIFSLINYFIATILFFSGVIKLIEPLPSIVTVKAAFNLPEPINIFIAAIFPLVEIGLAVLILLKNCGPLGDIVFQQ